MRVFDLRLSLFFSRTCENLQYLSVAHCSAFTDDGFLYLAGRKVGYNLIYLDLSGCTQVS